MVRAIRGLFRAGLPRITGSGPRPLLHNAARLPVPANCWGVWTQFIHRTRVPDALASVRRVTRTDLKHHARRG